MSLENVSLEEMESLATLSKTLADNPATRRQFLELIKTASPATNIPEIDMEYRMQERTKPLQDKLQSLESQIAENNFKEIRRANHVKLMDMGISKDEIGDVEKLMLDKQIGNFETAGQFYLSQKQVANPTAGTFSTPMTMPDVKEMGGDINQWARNQANEAINDILRTKR